MPNTISSKPHYIALDGLRGVAALMVLFYHVFEGYAMSAIDQKINHGYLAVDFFFLLSGFVIGYAYDDRWQKKSFTTWKYFSRRLIRLHPLVILGALLGAISFVLQGRVQWDGTPVATERVVVALILTMLMIPVSPHSPYEVRGNGELFPLNGPSWSLFFEYLGNVLYALLLRRASRKVLSGVVCLSGMGLVWYAVTNQSGAGHLGVGWTMAGNNFPGGFFRLLFSYSMGLFLSRVVHNPGEEEGALMGEGTKCAER